MPEGWTVETLLSSHRSMPYNPDIANTFFRVGVSTPDFRYDASGIWTTFKFEYPERAIIQSGPETTQKSDQKTTRKRPESDQSKQEDDIIELLKENPYISRKEISGRLGLHDSSVKRRLASLQEKGTIKRVGPDKGGHWEVQKGF